MRGILLAATALFAIATTSASAADMPAPVLKAPPPFAPYSWTGFYLGGQVGGAWVNLDYTHTNTAGTAESFDQSSSGFAFGGHAGVMYQTGNWVFGIEGTYTHLDSADETTASLLTADRSNSFHLKNMATVVGRLGTTTWWGDRTLLYVQGGWATAETDFRRFMTSTNSTTASSSGWDSGWTLGVGGAYAITNNIILGVEYNFARIDIGDRNQILAPGFVGTDTVTSANADIHQVTGRLSIKYP